MIKRFPKNVPAAFVNSISCIQLNYNFASELQMPKIRKIQRNITLDLLPIIP